MGEYRSQIKPLYGTPRSPLHWANQGLVGAWDMLEGSGLIAHDSSGNGNDGSLVGMAPMFPTSGWVPGPYGAALAFDGSNDYVKIDALDLSKTNQITVATRIKVGTKVALTNEYSIDTNTNNAFQCAVNEGVVGRFRITDHTSGLKYNIAYTSPSYSDGKYHTFIATIDRSLGIYQNTIWADGKIDTILSPTYQTDLSGNFGGPYPFFIGCRAGTNYFFDNPMSFFSIYNRALSAEEIAYLYAFPWCMYEDEKGMQEWLFNEIYKEGRK